MLKLKLPVLWPLDVKCWLIGKDTDAREDGGQEEKGMTEDEMVGWHHRLNGHGFGTPGVGDGQAGLVCCDSWGRRQSDTTEQLNWTEKGVWPSNRLRPTAPEIQQIVLQSSLNTSPISPEDSQEKQLVIQIRLHKWKNLFLVTFWVYDKVLEWHVDSTLMKWSQTQNFSLTTDSTVNSRSPPDLGNAFVFILLFIWISYWNGNHFTLVRKLLLSLP